MDIESKTRVRHRIAADTMRAILGEQVFVGVGGQCILRGLLLAAVPDEHYTVDHHYGVFRLSVDMITAVTVDPVSGYHAIAVNHGR